MKKTKAIWGLMVLVALILASCTGAVTNEAPVESPVAPVTGNTPDPLLTGTPVTGMDETPDGDATPVATVIGTLTTPDAGAASGVDASYLASSVMGQAATGADDGAVGTTQGLLIESATGQVRYVVLGYGEEGKLTLVPWEAFGRGRNNTLSVSGVTAEQAAAAPEFSDQVYNDYASGQSELETEVREYWSSITGESEIESTTPDADPSALVYLRPFTGAPLQDQDANLIGLMTDVVLDPRGVASYAVLTTDAGSPGQGQVQIPVPWNALSYLPESRTFALNFDVQELAAAPRLDVIASPDMSIQGWNQEWINYWQGINIATPAP
jgi:hypothetical protein